MATYKKVVLSRKLRRNSTFTEKIAWSMLRDRRMFGYRFKRQVVVRGFVLDFFCNDLRLAIEIDGPIHDRQKGYDALRQSIIESEGISFIRISTTDLEESPANLPDAIQTHIKRTKTE